MTFLNQLFLNVISGLIIALLMFIILLPFKNTLDQLTDLATSIEKSVSAITEMANINPEQISAVSTEIAESTKTVTESIGTGSADIIGKIKEKIGE